MNIESDSVQSFLSREFDRRVRANPRYSLRAYSRSLGLSSGALSEIMRKRRPLSLKAAARVAKALGLNESESNKLIAMIEDEKRKALGRFPIETRLPNTLSKQLDEDTFHLISEWHHFAILNLMDCDGFRWEASYIAKRLGLTIAQTKMAMNLLIRLGLVSGKGQVKSTPDNVVSPSGVPSTAVRKYHRQMLEKAIQSLETQNVEEREINGIGFAVDPDRLPMIKREINDFLDHLLAKHSKGKRHEVYFLETALFRLTQGERNETI